VLSAEKCGFESACTAVCTGDFAPGLQVVGTDFHDGLDVDVAGAGDGHFARLCARDPRRHEGLEEQK
jgi:hypothetical protein